MKAFTPCTPAHTSCSPAHADLVWSYRAERMRLEVQLELITGGYAGNIEHWKAKGGHIITFAEWLRAHKGKR